LNTVQTLLAAIASPFSKYLMGACMRLLLIRAGVAQKFCKA
jgi:hypothetical protein